MAMPSDTRFADRGEAGRRLASRLGRYRLRPQTVVFGLPRGGVVVAAGIAQALGLPLDVILSSKIGAPGNPEYAIGAVAEGGEPWWNEESSELAGATPEFRRSAVERQRQEILRRREVYRAGRALSLPSLTTVILVDDGVATGATIIAAIEALRRAGAARIVAAIPVAAPEMVDRLRRSVDELVVLETPPELRAVGAFYGEFPQVTDEEVCSRLAERSASQQ